jgi:imidazolonepropionase-like amidohydrolase
MRTILVLLLIILQSPVMGAQFTQTVPSQPLAFIHATIIDMTGANPKPNMTVVIIGNRIFDIGKTGKVRLPKNAQIIDATGKFLIPGLWDMHAHSSGEKTTREIFFPLEIANGVTGIRDMFSDCYPNCSFNNGGLDDGVSLEEVNEWRRRSAAGSLVAPRIITSSPLVDGLGASWQGSLIVRDADEGRDAVRYIKQRGSDFVKVYSRLSRGAYFALADEAKTQKLVFAGHIPDSISAIEASDAGQKSGEHLTGILLACSTDEAHLRSETLAWRENKAKMSRKEIDEKLLTTFDSAKADALFARFVANKTWMCPTLTVLRGGAFLDDKNFTNDVRLKYLPASLREDWRPANDPRFKDLTAADFALKRKRFQKYLEIVGAMHRAGVKILAGVDEPNQFCFPGFSLHDELALLVQAGLTPFEALKTATVNPAEYLGLTDSIGSIEKGKLADLILLDKNPLAYIGNTKRIRAVIFNGHFLSEKARRKMLANVELIANK